METAKYPLGNHRIEETDDLFIVHRTNKPAEVYRQVQISSHHSDGNDLVVKFHEDDDPDLTQRLIVEYQVKEKAERDADQTD